MYFESINTLLIYCDSITLTVLLIIIDVGGRGEGSVIFNLYFQCNGKHMYIFLHLTAYIIEVAKV